MRCEGPIWRLLSYRKCMSGSDSRILLLAATLHPKSHEACLRMSMEEHVWSLLWTRDTFRHSMFSVFWKHDEFVSNRKTSRFHSAVHFWECRKQSQNFSSVSLPSGPVEKRCFSCQSGLTQSWDMHSHYSSMSLWKPQGCLRWRTRRHLVRHEV
jgi:predicted transcriptional regulator